MKTLDQLPKNIKYVFCDIDDTLTTEGQLHHSAYKALWKLQEADIKIIPITGRPAGWCELIARMWPVDGVIGENGAFYFKYEKQKMKRIYFSEEKEFQERREKVYRLGQEVLKKFPGTALASDQFCRILDVAIDFCEDVPRLSLDTAKEIKNYFEKHGATAKVSSIHVNAWFGDHDKLKMCYKYIENEFASTFDKIQSQCVFAGDSPNDEPMFARFINSVGVANVLDFKDQIQNMPQYISTKKSGEGFVQLAEALLNTKI